MRRRRIKLPFSSSSPDGVTTITATDAVPADNAEALAKDDSQGEGVDRTMGADGLSDALATTNGGGGSSSLIIINITQHSSIKTIEDYSWVGRPIQADKN